MLPTCRILNWTMTAAEALSSDHFIKHDGSSPTAIGEKVAGVTTTDLEANEAGSVCLIGTTTVVAGGVVNPGDDLVTDANGAAIVNPALGGEYVIATAISSATANELVQILLR